MTISAARRNAQVCAIGSHKARVVSESVLNDSKGLWRHLRVWYPNKIAQHSLVFSILSSSGISHACLDGLNWQPFSRRRDKRLRGKVFIKRRRAVPPYRPRPGRIADNARDDMQVKLTDDIAERADIDLVSWRMIFQEPSGATHFVDQLRLIGGFQIDEFYEALAPWNENEPRPAGVVHQQHAA